MVPCGLIKRRHQQAHAVILQDEPLALYRPQILEPIPYLYTAAFGQTLSECPAAWHLGWLRQPSLASHALAVGAMGGLILAMMARVSLGHTGRALQPPKAMAWAFALLNLGALIRVAAGSGWLWLAAVCWGQAFALFTWHYAPMLCQARVDGHPG